MLSPPEKFPPSARFLIGLFLVVATFAVYWQVLSHGFVDYDDTMYVTANPNVQAGLAGIPWAFTNTLAGLWHPLTWISHMLDFQVYGLDPMGHHLTSLLFHVLNTLLLFGVLRRMTGAPWPSAWVAILFAVHPLHVESVAWVAERKDVLSTFFWMLTMWAYLRYVKHPTSNNYLLLLAAFFLGLLAKPTLVTLPFVLLLLDYWPLRRFSLVGTSKEALAKVVLKLVTEKLPLFFLTVMISIVTYFAQRSAQAEVPLEALPLDLRLANAIVAYCQYMGKMFFPYDLSFFYPHPGNTLSTWTVAGSAFLLAGISFLVLRSRRQPWLAVGWLWYLGTLVPVIGLVQVGQQAMADRYTYIPLIGLFIGLAFGVSELLSDRAYFKKVLLLPAVLLISSLMWLTHSQAAHWRNSMTLYEHALAVSNDNYLAHSNLGNLWARKGNPEEAVRHFSEVLRIKPTRAATHFNMGNAWAQMGEFDKAIGYFSAAIRFNPDFPEAYNNSGNVFARQNKFEEAATFYSTAVRLDPGYVEARKNLGDVLVRQGKNRGAVAHYLEALRYRPDFTDARFGLAMALANLGKFDEAVLRFFELMPMMSENVDLHYNLGVALLRQGKTGEAVKHFETVLELQPDNKPAQNVLKQFRNASPVN